jgi:hypothetical protein
MVNGMFLSRFLRAQEVFVKVLTCSRVVGTKGGVGKYIFSQGEKK